MATRSKKKSRFGSNKLWRRTSDFLSRRPHRSFRLTKRRDAVKPLNLPGYVALTAQVQRTFWKYRKHLISLALVYAVLYAVLIGVGSQETYQALIDSLTEAGNEVVEGGLDSLTQAGMLFFAVASAGLGQQPTDVQQVFGSFLLLMSWLTTVWLLRNLLAGHRVKLRDGLYNAGAPIIATFVVTLVFMVQLIPVALAAIGYTAASATGLLLGGVEAMLFWGAAIGLSLISAFWITSTFFALIIVTLPGTYPFKALSIAGDMVLGRRLKILLRLVWMALVMVVGWAIVLIPIILLDLWLKGVWSQFGAVPTVPIAVLALTSLTTVWAATYVYVLYRKVVDEDAKHK